MEKKGLMPVIAKSQSARYYTLDLIRGLAALWVASFHIAPQLACFGRFVHTIACYGFLGLYIFFVISGYCLLTSATSSLRRGESSLSFLYRRARRIYPPYWYSICVALALPVLAQLFLGFKTGSAFARFSSPPYSHYTPLDWLRIASLTQIFCPRGNFAYNAFDLINTAYWTLAIEIQFYLVVAIALAFRKWFAWILGLVTLASLVSFYFPKIMDTGLFLPYWPMFVLGMGTFWILNRVATPQQVFGKNATRIALAIIGTILIGGSCVVLKLKVDNINFPVSAMFALILWAGYAVDEKLMNLKSAGNFFVSRGARAAFLIGSMSYTIYLLHILIIRFYDQVSPQFIAGPAMLHAACLIFLILLASYPFYLFCERPFATAKRSITKGPEKSESVPSTVPEETCAAKKVLHTSGRSE